MIGVSLDLVERRGCDGVGSQFTNHQRIQSKAEGSRITNYCLPSPVHPCELKMTQLIENKGWACRQPGTLLRRRLSRSQRLRHNSRREYLLRVRLRIGRRSAEPSGMHTPHCAITPVWSRTRKLASYDGCWMKDDSEVDLPAAEEFGSGFLSDARVGWVEGDKKGVWRRRVDV
jgi:hypothetical protein